MELISNREINALLFDFNDICDCPSCRIKCSKYPHTLNEPHEDCYGFKPIPFVCGKYVYCNDYCKGWKNMDLGKVLKCCFLVGDIHFKSNLKPEVELD